eukprot:TRINITY_DN73936_c0_g1_i1.p1 TRINITY_DN73936_c0_g1~~TRINITY_DN73936_c0_g1_i1.p1  ORF type:complete len:280 (+),score=84.95 TRINITY_DN73936_c0_g1_i1:67-906(+)
MSVRGLVPVVLLAVLLPCRAGTVTGCSNPCNPAAKRGSSCSSDGYFDMRFAVGTLDGCDGDIATCGTNVFPSGDPCTTAGSGCTGYKTHFFCAKVDKFSAFTLSKSYLYLTAMQSHNNTAELAVYETGKLTADKVGGLLPELSQNSRVRVMDNSTSEDCSLIATFLIYNVTLKDGSYQYKNREPIGNGFESTCDSDNKCMFDSSAKCLPDPVSGRTNCAKCSNEMKAGEDDLRILTTYYGTDSGGNALLSGSSNPLNFRQFAVTGMANDIFDDIKGFKP